MNLLLIVGLSLLTFLVLLLIPVTVIVRRQKHDAPKPYTKAYLEMYREGYQARKQAEIDDLQESREYWNEKWAGHR